MFKNKKLKNHQMSELRTNEIVTLLNKTKQRLTDCSTRIVDLSPRKGVLFLTMEEKQEDQIQIPLPLPLPLVKLGTQGLEVNLFSFFTFLIFLPV